MSIRIGRAVAAGLVGVVVCAGVADAFVPDASAVLNGSFGAPVPAGSSVAASAQFSLGSDVGPINVSVELQNTGGLGTLVLNAGNTTAELMGCDDTSGVMISCTWDGLSANSPQTLSFNLGVDASVAPNQAWRLVALVDSLADADPPQELASVDVYTGPPAGSTALSGQVIGDGGVPIPSACVFALSTGYVFPAITDGQGEWSLGGLPDTYAFAVGVVPPFDGAFGPCADNGAPPVPDPGELQPVFYDDVWIDLSDPDLTGGQSDPYAFAVAQGATSITDSLAGIVSCLTTAPGDVVPRPACIQTTTTSTTAATTSTTAATTAPTTTAATTSTTAATTAPTTTAATTSTTAATTAPTTTPLLPATGTQSSSRVLVGASVLMLLGGVAVVAARGFPVAR